MTDRDGVPAGSYRTGEHNPRNIYRAGVDRQSDEHVAVAFAPEMGRLIVESLNATLREAVAGGLIHDPRQPLRRR